MTTKNCARCCAISSSAKDSKWISPTTAKKPCAAPTPAVTTRVILDVMLPQRSGLELLRELRRSSKLPVLMLTALGEDIDRILGLELGADDYVPKPCNPREIAARLRAILRRTQGDSEGPRLSDLTIGTVALRAASRSVTVRGEPVALTGTEFNILAVLMREAGRVVSKETLSQDRARSPARSVRPQHRRTHFQIAA